MLLFKRKHFDILREEGSEKRETKLSGKGDPRKWRSEKDVDAPYKGYKQTTVSREMAIVRVFAAVVRDVQGAACGSSDGSKGDWRDRQVLQ